MGAAPLACLDPLLEGLGDWLDRSQHDQLTDEDIAVFNTPEGMLSSEVVPEGVYVPEVVISKNVRKARGRFKVRPQSSRLGGQKWLWCGVGAALRLFPRSACSIIRSSQQPLLH